MFSSDPNPDTATKINVALLEDGRYDRLGMVTELKADPAIDLLCETAAPEDLQSSVGAFSIEVAIVDLRIYDDDMAGLNVIRLIKRDTPWVKVIVLTAFPELVNFIAAFDLGVEAFVKKAAAAWRPALPELVHIVAEGGRYYDPDLTSVMRKHLSEIQIPTLDSDRAATSDDPPVSKRELEVLEGLARNESDAEIAARLVLSRHTVRTHVRNILGKLGARDRRDAVLIAATTGLLNRGANGKNRMRA